MGKISRRWKIAGAALILVVLVVGGIIGWTRWQAARQESRRKAEVEKMFDQLDDSRKNYDKRMDRIIYGTDDEKGIEQAKAGREQDQERSTRRSEYNQCVKGLEQAMRETSPTLSATSIYEILYAPDSSGKSLAQQGCGEEPAP